MLFAISLMFLLALLTSPDLIPPALPFIFASSLVLIGFKSHLATSI
nr:MAG TPA: hypothetical protein [Caudoviricetes sp.]